MLVPNGIHIVLIVHVGALLLVVATAALVGVEVVLGEGAVVGGRIATVINLVVEKHLVFVGVVF